MATGSGATDAVARCLLREEGRTAGVADWYGSVGEEYRRRTEAVLATLARFDSGIQSGGLPPERSRMFGLPVFVSEAVPRGAIGLVPGIPESEVRERLREQFERLGRSYGVLPGQLLVAPDPPRVVPAARLGPLREALALRIAPWLRLARRPRG